MADKKISQLTNASTPLAGTEVLPIVQGGSTVKVSAANLTAGRSISASGLTLSGGTANGVLYLNGSNVVTSGSTLQSNGTNLGVGGAPDASVVLDIYTAGGRLFTRAGSSTGGTASGVGFTATNTAASAIVDLNYRATNHAFISGTGSSTAMLVDSSGNVKVENGNFIVGTAAKGIDFSANTGAAGMTSELLNWYEEGTWTGTLTATTPPTTPVTATGRYTRIGRQVTVNIEFDNKNTTGASGAMSVTGLPFTAGSAGYGPTMKNSMGANVITATVSGGGSSISFSDAADMTNFNIVAAAGIYLRLSVTYFV